VKRTHRRAHRVIWILLPIALLILLQYAWFGKSA